MSKKSELEYKMDFALRQSDWNREMYKETGDEEYLENYYRYYDDYRQYSWELKNYK